MHHFFHVHISLIKIRITVRVQFLIARNGLCNLLWDTGIWDRVVERRNGNYNLRKSLRSTGLVNSDLLG